MVMEDYDENFDLKNTNSLLLSILQNNTYINTIKTEMRSIMSDCKIDIADLPHMLNIVLISKPVLSKFINSKTTITQIHMKYIIYGIMVFALLLLDVQDDALNLIFAMYPSLWNIVEFNPNNFKTMIQEKIKSGCCK